MNNDNGQFNGDWDYTTRPGGWFYRIQGNTVYLIPFPNDGYEGKVSNNWSIEDAVEAINNGKLHKVNYPHISNKYAPHGG